MSTTVRVLLLAAWCALAALSAGCRRNLLEEVLTEANTRELLQRVQRSHDLTPEEATLVSAYALRVELARSLHQTPPPVNQPLRALVAAQRTFLAQLEREEREREAQQARDRAAAEAARRQAEQQRAAVVTQLRATVSAVVLRLQLHHADIEAHEFEDTVRVSVRFTNTSARALRGARGTLRFFDTFGTEVDHRTFSLEQDVAPGASYTGEWTVNYNQFVARDRALANFALDRGRVDWEPEQVVFADGAQVQAPTL